jgi:hypothetical protein
LVVGREFIDNVVQVEILGNRLGQCSENPPNTQKKKKKKKNLAAMNTPVAITPIASLPHAWILQGGHYYSWFTIKQVKT